MKRGYLAQGFGLVATATRNLLLPIDEERAHMCYVPYAHQIININKEKNTKPFL